MSASKNTDAVANQGGEFSSRVPPSEPLTTSGHKPGVLASENDRAPEFSAQVLPAGTAPANATYQPNPDIDGQGMYQDASKTIQGATSADVHTGLGHPGQGQSSKELRHDQSKGTGLAGLTSGLPDKSTTVSGQDPAHAAQRNLGDVPTGQRGTTGGPAAQDREPETMT